MSVADLLRMPAPVLVLDIRRPKEFESAHFDGAVILDHKNPSLDQLEAYRVRNCPLKKHTNSQC